MVGRRLIIVWVMAGLALLGGGSYLAYHRIFADTAGNCGGGGLALEPSQNPTPQVKFLTFDDQTESAVLWYHSPSLEPVSIYADVVFDGPTPDQLPPDLSVTSPLPQPELYARVSTTKVDLIPLSASSPTTVQPRQNGRGVCGFSVYVQKIDRPGKYTIRAGTSANVARNKESDPAFVVTDQIDLFFYKVVLNPDPSSGLVRIPSYLKGNTKQVEALKKSAQPVTIQPDQSLDFELGFYGMTATNFPTFYAGFRDPHFVITPDLLDTSNPINLAVFVNSSPYARVSWWGKPEEKSLPSDYSGYLTNRSLKGFRLPFNGTGKGGIGLDDFFTGTLEVTKTSLYEGPALTDNFQISLSEWVAHPNWYIVMGGNLKVQPKKFTVTFPERLCNPDVLIQVGLTETNQGQVGDNLFLRSPLPEEAIFSVKLNAPREPIFIGQPTKPEIPLTVSVANRTATKLYATLADVAQRGEVIKKYGTEVTGQYFVPQTWKNVIGDQSTQLKNYPDTPGLIYLQANGEVNYLNLYNSKTINICQSSSHYTALATYKLKIFPQKENQPDAPPQIDVGSASGTEILLGLDGWERIKNITEIYNFGSLKTPVNWRDIFKNYFTGKNFVLTMLDQAGNEIPGFEYSTDGGQNWQPLSKPLPIDTNQWTADAARQSLMIRHLSGLAQSQATLRVTIAGTDASQDFSVTLGTASPGPSPTVSSQAVPNGVSILISVNPAQPRVGEQLNFEIRVINQSGNPASFTLETTLDGTVLDKRQVTLDVGATQIFSVSAQGLTAGQHGVTVGPTSQTFTVQEQETPSSVSSSESTLPANQTPLTGRQQLGNIELKRPGVSYVNQSATPQPPSIAAFVGETLVLTGAQGRPGSTFNLQIFSDPITTSITIGSDGTWSYTLPSLEVGDHRILAQFPETGETVTLFNLTLLNQVSEISPSPTESVISPSATSLPGVSPSESATVTEPSPTPEVTITPILLDNPTGGTAPAPSEAYLIVPVLSPSPVPATSEATETTPLTSPPTPSPTPPSIQPNQAVVVQIAGLKEGTQLEIKIGGQSLTQLKATAPEVSLPVVIPKDVTPGPSQIVIRSPEWQTDLTFPVKIAGARQAVPIKPLNLIVATAILLLLGGAFWLRHKLNASH